MASNREGKEEEVPPVTVSPHYAPPIQLLPRVWNRLPSPFRALGTHHFSHRQFQLMSTKLTVLGALSHLLHGVGAPVAALAELMLPADKVAPKGPQ